MSTATQRLFHELPEHGEPDESAAPTRGLARSEEVLRRSVPLPNRMRLKGREGLRG